MNVIFGNVHCVNIQTGICLSQILVIRNRFVQKQHHLKNQKSINRTLVYPYEILNIWFSVLFDSRCSLPRSCLRQSISLWSVVVNSAEFGFIQNLCLAYRDNGSIEWIWNWGLCFALEWFKRIFLIWMASALIWFSGFSNRPRLHRFFAEVILPLP